MNTTHPAPAQMIKVIDTWGDEIEIDTEGMTPEEVDAEIAFYTSKDENEDEDPGDEFWIQHFRSLGMSEELIAEALAWTSEDDDTD